MPNGTLPVNPVFVATQHKVLFELAGAGPESLVNNVTIRGLRLYDNYDFFLFFFFDEIIPHILLGPFLYISQLRTTPHLPFDVLYLLPMLAGF